ncbi:MAG: peptidyl-prolyl cis-trans isomerase [Vicinamibacterales bacterium]|nr:hypothetical protein [Acidobacteriota bacterium]MDP7294071.1 peptidyl-prolyl cis-trans isomerase [Vicinamibacterales bacterium]MDP7473040.1 peptidyl-prolyl cis-trans isomerase [Vicinamibacterales bacterium]MDP7670926.1 peptidyl-prolyl cis-trans isomerase [Vicinamibacterales bacterium]HJO39670.1 peptidyl-prolyl cis-trans isomerase [Vicinamibacterales bacterium]
MRIDHRAGTLAAVTIALSVAAAGAAAAQNIILQEILVKVNGAIITKTELEERQVQLLREYRQQGLISETTGDAELEAFLNEATPQIVVDAIDELLILQHGRDLGIEMDDERFAGIVDNVKEQNNIATDEEFNEVLAAEGMTMEDLERAMERQFIISSVQQIEVIGKVAMTDTEAREYYDRNTDEYRTPGQIALREILVAAPADAATGADNRLVSAAAEAELEARFQAALARVAAGETFATVATEASDAPSSANGGLIGPLSEDDLAPAVAALLEGLAAGEISEPVRTAIGYQVFLLESSTPATRQPFDEVRDDIANRVFNERRQDEFNEFMGRLHVEAILEWNNENLQQAYENRMQAIQGPTAGS